MKQAERDYLLKIINLQDALINTMAPQNTNKFLVIHKELEDMKKASFNDYMLNLTEEKKGHLKRFKNLITEIEAVVKEL